ncbi:mechanosensitive ion channel family protein [Demetria terragena]|uniref:mechanosensitive ion channel family protein n=1 Tax=Demetria terragena TaxID=63959 RepID=UPI0003610576|nr:mechanosensitive ion channel family protein [Demetria terragena]
MSPTHLPLLTAADDSGLTWEKTTDWFLGAPARILVIIVIAIAARWLIHRAIRRVVHQMERPADGGSRATRVLREAAGLDALRRRQRAATTGTVLKSTTTIVISAIAIITILGAVGIPIGPLMASAGVGGVALGFGAQSLVKDFLSGIFMIVEDQYGVGDIIDTGEAIGEVEEVTLRITRLRDANGVIWYVRNGEIIRIGNRSQGWSMAVIDVPVAYTESVEKVTSVLRGVVEHIRDEEPWDSRVLETPEVAGVENVSAGVMTMRIFAKCAANENFSVTREIREQSKEALDAAGIAGPPVTAYGQGGATRP